MSEELYTLTENQIKEIDLLLAYSNAVSMALRSPGGRSHSWTLGKIGHLYDQQCKVESIMKSLKRLQAPVVPSFCVGCVHCFMDECSDWQGTLPTDGCKDKVTLGHRET
jgi:hypothetical protein